MSSVAVAGGEDILRDSWRWSEISHQEPHSTLSSLTSPHLSSVKSPSPPQGRVVTVLPSDSPEFLVYHHGSKDTFSNFT